jgi:aspartate/methionine/tyrosine aminotransferase
VVIQMTPPRPSSILSLWGEPSSSTLDALVSARRAAGLSVVDLVTATPHEHGLRFPPGIIERALPAALARSLAYSPDARGQHDAREAIARHLASRGVNAPADSIVLTPGTSLAYFALFRLLGEHRGEVLVASPTYPLFDDIAALAGCTTRSYHLRRADERWRLDAGEVEHQLTPHTRAIVLVSPHNPTGHVASDDELHALAELCRARSLPLIVDEVFAEFPIALDRVPRAAEGRFGFPLVLTLDGFSKMLALPGHKTAWIAVTGTEVARAAQLLRALEHLMDTLLPVHEVAQALVAPLLDASVPVIEGFRTEYRARHAALREALASVPGVKALPVEGGVYQPILLESPRARSLTAEELLRDHGLLVHPGAWYGLAEPSLVATFVAGEEALREAARILGEGLAAGGRP